MDVDGMIDPGMEYLPPPSRGLLAGRKVCVASSHIKREDSEDEEGRQREDTLEEPGGQGQGLAVSAGDAGGPERRRTAHADKESEAGRRCGHMTLLSPYQEKLLLSRLDACPLALAVTPQARRLRGKLRLRQAKRQRGLPLLDLDRTVSTTLSLVGGLAGVELQRGIMGKYCSSSKELRILDRFQVRPVPPSFLSPGTLLLKEWTNQSTVRVVGRSGPPGVEPVLCPGPCRPASPADEQLSTSLCPSGTG